jgi:hypothetical protein
MKTSRNQKKPNRQFRIYQETELEGVATLQDIIIEQSTRIYGSFIFEDGSVCQRWANLDDELIKEPA